MSILSLLSKIGIEYMMYVNDLGWHQTEISTGNEDGMIIDIVFWITLHAWRFGEVSFKLPVYHLCDCEYMDFWFLEVEYVISFGLCPLKIDETRHTQDMTMTYWYDLQYCIIWIEINDFDIYFNFHVH